MNTKSSVAKREGSRVAGCHLICCGTTCALYQALTMATKYGTQLNKIRLLTAMSATYCNIGESCKRVGIARSTFTKYMRVDPEFRARVENLTVHLTHMLESLCLKRTLECKDIKELQRLLERRGAHRGYGRT